MTNIVDNLLFVFDRLTWESALDIILVTAIFFVLLIFLRKSQAIVLIRGIILLIIVISLITTLFDLPAFSWLISAALPTLLLAVPVVFAPEIRRALERIGRASELLPSSRSGGQTQDTISSVVHAAERLSNRRHGALIILQRFDSMEEYIETGVKLEALVTPEILLQIFYPNTPLHDGAVIIVGNRVAAAGCVMPLSASGVLNLSVDRKMGLRHRAALGSSEVSDSVAVVVSEETGSISIATGGRMIHRLDRRRLEGILRAIYRSTDQLNWFERFFARILGRQKTETAGNLGED
ncbi:MAG: diadenylate cyclase CdaA [Anaerolineales bacterium]|nr:diadenylate cyclase CdaA [Anaerolineales bacterium]